MPLRLVWLVLLWRLRTEKTVRQQLCYYMPYFATICYYMPCRTICLGKYAVCAERLCASFLERQLTVHHVMHNA